MRFLFFLYRFYVGVGSLLLALALYIVGWKKAVLKENALRCGLAVPCFRFRWYTHVASDFLRLIHSSYGRPIRTRPQDQDKLKNLKSTASLFLTAHFHHWELMGGWLVKQGIPLLSAARPMSQAWAQFLLSYVRSRLTSRTVESNMARKALSHLDQKGCFALLWDQRASGSQVRAPSSEFPWGWIPYPPF
jgi:hypothetical protein